MARGRKPEVSIEQANEWLRRVDNGESIKEIGKGDNFVERTVKKYVDQARERQETTQARTMVYKDALEKHFKDLTSMARKLDQAVSSGKNIAGEIKDPLYSALKEHQPNSKLWVHISEWNALLSEIDSLRENFKAAIKNDAASNPLLQASFIGGAMDTENIGQAMMRVADSLLGGYPGIRAVNALNPKPIGDPDLVIAQFGGFNLGNFQPDRMSDLVLRLTDLENRLPGFGQFQSLKTLAERQSKLKEAIHDLLTVFILKRVISGHCRYCPF